MGKVETHPESVRTMRAASPDMLDFFIGKVFRLPLQVSHAVPDNAQQADTVLVGSDDWSAILF